MCRRCSIALRGNGRQRTERLLPRFLLKTSFVFWTSILDNDFLRHGAPRACSADRSTASIISTCVRIRPKRSDPAKTNVPERCFASTPQGRRPSSSANEVAKIAIIRLFRTRAPRTKTGFRRQRHDFSCARTETQTCCGDFTVRKWPKCQRARDNLSRGYMTDA